jgi:hypothetical protein
MNEMNEIKEKKKKYFHASFSSETLCLSELRNGERICKNMRRVLILQHDWECHKGYIGNILKEYNIADDVVHVPEDMLPDPSVYAAIFAFGGSISTRATYIPTSLQKKP